MKSWSTGNDNKKCNDYSCDTSYNNIYQCVVVILHLKPFFNNRRLHIELHPGSYSGSYYSNHHCDTLGTHIHPGMYNRWSNFRPVRFSHHCWNNVGEQWNAEYKKDTFSNLVITFYNQNPDHKCNNRDREIFGNTKYLHTTCHTCKFSGCVANISKKKSDEYEEGYFHSSIFADQVCQPFPGNNSHPCIHLLNDQKKNKWRYQRPYKTITVHCSRNRICCYTSGIIIYTASYNSRTQYRKKDCNLLEEFFEIELCTWHDYYTYLLFVLLFRIRSSITSSITTIPCKWYSWSTTGTARRLYLDTILAIAPTFCSSKR